MKLCNKCKIEKPLGEFGINKRSPDGLYYYCKLCRKIYRKENRDSINSYNRAYEKHKKDTDLNFKLKCLLRSRIWKRVKTNAKLGSSVKDLGCSVEELRIYLESKFQPGMTWENIGQWHIDHIKPLSKFDLTNKEQFLLATHYTNLQPLWAEDNIKKGNKME